MSRVEPNRNVYIGHRYVPLLVGEWDKSVSYEGLSIVTYQGGSYTSKKMTPPGIDIENEEYWVLTGNYNAQIEYYRQETQSVKDDLIKKVDIEDYTIFETNTNKELDKKVDNTNYNNFVNEISEKMDTTNQKIDDRGINISDSTLNTLIDEIGDKNETLIITPGVHDINENITIPENITLKFLKGGAIKINDGYTIEINGEIVAGDYEIFKDGGGVIDKTKSATFHNLAWYEGGSINKKYDFCRKSFVEFRHKIIYIPKPYKGQSGTMTYDDENRVYWAVDDEILIDDNGNSAEWIVMGEFRAKSNLTDFIRVQGSNKPENVYFYGTIQFNTSSDINVECGINIIEGTRINFYDQVLINGANTSVKIGGYGQVSGSHGYFNHLHCAFYSNHALLVDGNTTSNSTAFDIITFQASTARTPDADAILIKGIIRKSSIGRITQSSNEPKAGFPSYDVANVVHIQSYDTKSIRHVRIGEIYSDGAENGVKISSLSEDRSLISDVNINMIYMLYDKNYFDIDYCTRVIITNLENTSSNLLCHIGQDAVATSVQNMGNANIEDLGANTKINGLGKQSRGNNPPAPSVSSWEIGNLIREESNGNIYMRVAKNGDESDFILIQSGG